MISNITQKKLLLFYFFYRYVLYHIFILSNVYLLYHAIGNKDDKFILSIVLFLTGAVFIYMLIEYISISLIKHINIIKDTFYIIIELLLFIYLNTDIGIKINIAILIIIVADFIIKKLNYDVLNKIMHNGNNKYIFYDYMVFMLTLIQVIIYICINPLHYLGDKYYYLYYISSLISCIFLFVFIKLIDLALWIMYTIYNIMYNCTYNNLIKCKIKRCTIDIPENVTYLQDISIDNISKYILNLKYYLKCPICNIFINKIIYTNDSSDKCNICIDNRRNILFVKCKHHVCCMKCIYKMEKYDSDENNNI